LPILLRWLLPRYRDLSPLRLCGRMHKILINREWVGALSSTGREIKNPATLELLGTVPDCG
jgi:hypothetical protein